MPDLFVLRCSVALLAGALGAGCSLDYLAIPTDDPTDAGPKPAPCKTGFVGDPALDMVMEVTALGVDEVSSKVEDGSVVPLIEPPQGGRVVFVGVRARNVNACGARITGVLRDPGTGKIVIDARTVNLRPTPDGYVGSTDTDISSFSNIPVCPNQWSTRDAFGSEYELEMSLKDRDGRTLKTTHHVTLECAEPENEVQCKCRCKAGYVLGEKCDSDGGTPP